MVYAEDRKVHLVHSGTFGEDRQNSLYKFKSQRQNTEVQNIVYYTPRKCGKVSLFQIYKLTVLAEAPLYSPHKQETACSQVHQMSV